MPPGNHFTAPLHGILPDTARSTSTATSIVLYGITIITNIKWSAAMSRAQPLPCLICLRNPHHPHWQFGTIQQYWLDLTQGFQLDLAQLSQLNSTQVFDMISLRFPWLNSTQGFWLGSTQFYRRDSTHSFWLDLTQAFSNSVLLTFNAIIFDLSQIIWVPFQSCFREHHIGQGVFKIIQHWNHEISHNSDNSMFLVRTLNTYI